MKTMLQSLSIRARLAMLSGVTTVGLVLVTGAGGWGLLKEQQDFQRYAATDAAGLAHLGHSRAAPPICAAAKRTC